MILDKKTIQILFEKSSITNTKVNSKNKIPEPQYIEYNANSPVIFLLNPAHSDMDLIDLKKIIMACKLGEKPNIASHPSLQAIIHTLPQNQIVYFAKNEEFKPQFFNKPFHSKGKQILITQTISELMTKPELKKQFWNQGLRILLSI